MKLKKVLLFAAAGMVAFNLLACSPKNSANKENTEEKQETEVNNKNSKENKQEGNSEKENKVKEKTLDTILSQEEMKEDLDSLVKTLNDVHPKTLNGFSEEQQSIIDKAYEKIKEPMKMEEFYFVTNDITCSFKDAHTSMYMNMSGEDKVIDLYPVWLHDGLYVKESVGELQKGDKILSIGEKTPKKLLIELSKVISPENDNFIKLAGCYNIVKEPYLRHLNLIEDNYVNAKIERKDKEMEVKLPLIAVNNSKAYPLMYEIFNHEKWVSYTIDKENSLGVFKLDNCNYNKEYKETLKEFFEEVSQNNIQNIAVDLRENSGGDSSVVNEFIRYLDVEKYLSFGIDIRYSSEASKQRGFGKVSVYESNLTREKINKKIPSPELLFKGNVYAITSLLTFSSANDFAVILKDNDIGEIIGESTSNEPSSYGDKLGFSLPNTGLKYSISFKKFTRPNTDNDPANYLTPDVIVYTTIEDIVNDRDPQMKKLKELIKQKYGL